MASKPSKKDIPKPPGYTPAPQPTQPVPAGQAYLDIFTQVNPTLIGQSDTKIGQDNKATNALNKTIRNQVRKGTRQLTRMTNRLEEKYAPRYADLYSSILDEQDPYWQQVRDKTGELIMADLDAGRGLGAELSREIEQDIRGAQDARGNWYGPAPTADEAFRKGSAREALYQQRLGNASGFTNGRSTVDMFTPIRSGTSATQFYQPVTASGGYDPSGAMTLTGMDFGNQQNYFSNLLASYTADQGAQYRDYGAQRQNYGDLWSRWLFDEYGEDAIKRSLNPPGLNWMQRMIKGASTGAEEGSMFGPWGAIGGAAGGAFDGAVNGPIYQAHFPED